MSPVATSPSRPSTVQFPFSPLHCNSSGRLSRSLRVPLRRQFRTHPLPLSAQPTFLVPHGPDIPFATSPQPAPTAASARRPACRHILSTNLTQTRRFCSLFLVCPLCSSATLRFLSLRLPPFYLQHLPPSLLVLIPIDARNHLRPPTADVEFPKELDIVAAFYSPIPASVRTTSTAQQSGMVCGTLFASSFQNPSLESAGPSHPNFRLTFSQFPSVLHAESTALCTTLDAIDTLNLGEFFGVSRRPSAAGAHSNSSSYKLSPMGKLRSFEC
ncbi:hypothetical protein B0H16DRAFT_1728216 [Mycena metata]|uniref:Uncharacterized protein n=1 Tax=Mycena metata TaxID=1033252 RepID=A0AAD7N228_9AGAR|nr:hypothetical protein B0H16DRAFT_1728216 [Mycena metata]